MKEINEEARSRLYAELGACLPRAGYKVLPEQDGLLPLEWNGIPICRITAGGGAQFHSRDLEPDGAEEAFDRATCIAHDTAEYLRLLETAQPLTANGLSGDYRLLAELNGAVLAGHPTAHGVEFVTWEWDYEQTGLWQGHYYGNNYAGAKQDFALRAGLIDKGLLFGQGELDELYRCCKRTRELDGTIGYRQEQEIIKVQDHIEAINPGVRERVLERQKTLESGMGLTQG